MMSKFLTFTRVFFILSFIMIIFHTCSKDSTDPQGNPEPIDVLGSWSLTTTITANTCGLANGEVNTEFIYLTDTSGVQRIINFDGNWGLYSVDGSAIQFTGSEETERLGCLATLSTAGSGIGTESEISGSFVTTSAIPPAVKVKV